MPLRRQNRSGFVRSSPEELQRRQYALREIRRLFDAPAPDYDTDEDDSSSFDYNPRQSTPPTRRQHRYFTKRYRSTDPNRRHRIRDDEEKDEKVVSYKRRPGH